MSMYMCACTADWPLAQLTAIPQQLFKLASASSVVKWIIPILTVWQYIKPTVQDGSTADWNNYFMMYRCLEHVWGVHHPRPVVHVHVSLILHGTPIVCMAAWGYIANMHLESIIHGMLYAYIYITGCLYMQYVHTYLHTCIRMYRDCRQILCIMHDVCMCCSTTVIYFYVR